METPIKTIFDNQQKHFRETVKNSSADQRIKKLKKLRRWILEHQQDIRDALNKDFRKAETEVDLSEIKATLIELDHAIKNLTKWLRPKKVRTPLILIGSHSFVRFEPKGVCLILSPWNYPFMLTIAPLIPAIAAGNCVIVKPSEISRHTTELMLSMAQSLFNENEIAFLSGDHLVAAELLKLPFDHIFFTGSPPVGKIVMEAAAKNLTSVTLELGGQNPVIVDETAHIKDTAKRLVYGKFLNNGQSCVAPNFVFVHESRQDDLCDALVEEINKFFPGRITENPDFARIINKNNFTRLQNLIEDALAKKAVPVTELKLNKDECFIAPFITKNTPDNTLAFSEEIFGPYLPVTCYQHLEDVIFRINKNNKPLAVYIFSQSKKNIKYILDNTPSGAAGINETTLHFSNPYLPFGGISFSGIGRTHGHYGFLAFSNERAVLRQRNGLTTTRLVEPPFTKLTKKIVQLIIKYL